MTLHLTDAQAVATGIAFSALVGTLVGVLAEGTCHLVAAVSRWRGKRPVWARKET